MTCLEYLCQLFWVPPELLKLEARAISKTLRIPHHAYGVHGPFQLKQFGLLSIRSLVAINCAAMFRASRVTLHGWRDGWCALLGSLNSVPASSSPSPLLAPSCWDSPPITARLFNAFNGFRDNFLRSIPPHILTKIQGSFHNIAHFKPYGPILSPIGAAPENDRVLSKLLLALRTSPHKPQKQAYEVFVQVLHPLPFPNLIFTRASRWLLKYFSFQISQDSIHNMLVVLGGCHSPFFASLIIRTLAYAWTTGTRFSNSLSDNLKSPFCDFGPQRLPHIISCPKLLSPLLLAINSELKHRGIHYCFDESGIHSRNDLLPLLFPVSPSSPLPLLPMALSCDMFNCAKSLTFSSSMALNAFVKDRVPIACDKFGHEFWDSCFGTLVLLAGLADVVGDAIFSLLLLSPILSLLQLPPMAPTSWSRIPCSLLIVVTID